MNDLWQRDFVPDIREPRVKDDRNRNRVAAAKLEELLFGDRVLTETNSSRKNDDLDESEPSQDVFVVDTDATDNNIFLSGGKRVFDVSSDEQLLRDEYQRLHGSTNDWSSKVPRKRKRAVEDGTQDDIESVLRSVAQVTDNASQRLIKDAQKSISSTDTSHIRVSPFIDLNQSCRNMSPLCCVKFRKNDDDNIFLTACTKERTLNIFRLTGVGTNSSSNRADSHEQTSLHLHSLLLDDLPVTYADFIGRDSVVIVGHRPFVMKYDLRNETCSRKFGLSQPSHIDPHNISTISACSVNDEWVAISGKRTHGKIFVLSSRSLELAFEIQMNCNATCLSFVSGNSTHELISSGPDADVYLWDVRMMGSIGGCVSRFTNEDGTSTTALNAVNNDSLKMIAIGSDSGVVSLYDYQKVSEFRSDSPLKPEKATMNLQTPISAISFSNCSGQNIMGFSSFEKANAMRLMHLPSYKVLSHWPSSFTRLKSVNCMDFLSLESSVLMAIGNNKGASQCFNVQF